MLVVHVHVQVKANQVDAFVAATRENAENSVKEPGIARFDVVQQQDDPTRFVLVEVYRTAYDPAKHKETAHYQKWRDTVAEMMAVPRSSVKYANVFPSEGGWDYIEATEQGSRDSSLPRPAGFSSAPASHANCLTSSRRWASGFSS